MIGGGLAGLAAACALADRGWRVALLEKGRWLGGRASSFPDPEAGHPVDLGQHIFLRCFTAYLGLLERLGVKGKVSLQPSLRVPLVDAASGKRGVLFAQPWLPPPFHLLAALLAYPHLTPWEKGRAPLPLLHLWGRGRLDGAAPEGVPLDCWLRGLGQTERLVRRLWEPVLLGALNAFPHQVSALMGAFVLRHAFLTDPHAADIGWAAVPLSALLEDAARRYLQMRGGAVHTRCPVVGLRVEGERVEEAVLASGERVRGEVFIAAVPWHTLPSLLPPHWRAHPFFARCGALRGVPILNVHLWYDRAVMREPFLGFLGSPVQWVFNKTALWALPGPGQHLTISISGAEAYVGKPREEVVAAFAREMERLFPRARDARLVHARAVLVRNATFCPAPGTEALRPPPQTPIANLFVAGDWTSTGWPSTMEGAVRSGLLAAEAVGRGGP